MRKLSILFFVSLMIIPSVWSQSADSYDLGIGLRIQKTEQLYWENGFGVDYTSDFLLNRKIHLKLSYISSRMGSAFNTNAIKQDNYLIGADWRFRSEKSLQIFAGFNTGFFHADMETPQFNVLPHNSMLFSLETGLAYKFKFPMGMNLSLGYNLINGNGVNTPGTLFPLFYEMSIFYYLNLPKKSETKNLAPSNPPE